MSRIVLVLAGILALISPTLGQPTAPDAAQLAILREASSGPRRAAATTPLTVNTASREEVRQFYRAIHGASEGVPMGWTGNYASGAAGDTSAAYKEAVRLRINFFRALAGLPATVTLNSTFNAKAQKAALMMSGNNQLNHFPPASWTYYTADGAEAAGKSNIALGNAGPDAISAYIRDDGAGNEPVGHRRWLLYPQTLEMGTGDVPGGNGTSFSEANAVWVFDAQFGTTRPSTRTPAITYPPADFIPYTLVWPRWSFSHPNADFSTASVTMTRNGQAVSVVPEQLSTGAGEPTLVWVYDGLDRHSATVHPRPSADTTYTVNVNNVRIAGNLQNFTYQVTVFDPDVAGTDFAPVTVSGSAAPAVGHSTTYTVARPAFAGSFDWRTLQLSSFAKTYGAESGLDGVAAAVSSGYSVVQTGTAGAGTAAFHLAHPLFESQTLTLPETFYVTSTGAAVNFLSRLGWATAAQVARVQVSADEGVSWADIFSQAGLGTSGEAGFAARSASLSDYVGRTVRVRFNYTVTDLAFTQTNNGVGWYIDNVTVSGVQSATAAAATAVSAGTTFSLVPAAAGAIGLQARGVLFGAYPLEWGPVAPVTAANVTVPVFVTQPVSHTLANGGSVTLTTSATANATYQWQFNGSAVSGATTASLALNNVGPANTGLYAAVATNSGVSTISRPAIVGLSASGKVIGTATEIAANILHPTLRIFDQILLEGPAATFKSDFEIGDITRLSYIDLNNDIVQVEFAGPGAVSIVLEGISGPAQPVNYIQGTSYVKGHAGIVVTGATEATNLTVFTVGTATGLNPAIFRNDVTYDGLADIAFIAIQSSNGKFGGLRTANVSYFATKGFTGVYAPGVTFEGPVFVSDIDAREAATPMLILGAASDVRITGGALEQTNGRAVQVSGITQLQFRNGSTSHTGGLLSAKANAARLEENGVDVTTQIAAPPTP